MSGPDYLLEEDDAPRRGVNWTAVVGIVLLLAVAGAMLAAWKQAGFDGIRQSASDFWHQRLMKEQKTSAAKPGAEQPATGGQGGATSSSQPMPANPTDAGNSQPTMTSENSAPAAPAQAAANNAVGSSPSASDAKPESDQVSSDTDKKAKAASEGKPAPAASPSAKSDEADAATASTPADGEAKTLTHSATANRPRTEPAQDLYDKGQSYLLGRGVPQSCPQALVFTRAAAREGSFRAATQLGALYATGRCVEIDRVQAYRWFSQAQQLDPTNSWVERNRDSLWAQMTEEQRIQAGKE